MRGAIPPLPQYAFTAWLLIKSQGLYPFFLHLHTIKIFYPWNNVSALRSVVYNFHFATDFTYQSLLLARA